MGGRCYSAHSSRSALPSTRALQLERAHNTLIGARISGPISVCASRAAVAASRTRISGLKVRRCQRAHSDRAAAQPFSRSDGAPRYGAAAMPGESRVRSCGDRLLKREGVIAVFGISARVCGAHSRRLTRDTVPHMSGPRLSHAESPRASLVQRALPANGRLGE